MAKLFKKSWRSIKKLCICGRSDIVDDQLVGEPFSGDNSAVEVQAVASNSDISFYDRIKSTSNRCAICNMECTTLFYCQPCNARKFQSRFKDWTSGIEKLDEFIQKSQVEAKKHSEIIEFIPYEHFRDVRYEIDGGFGCLYSATWKPGPIETFMEWNNQKKDWKRKKSELVALKKFKISQTVSDEFIKALAMQIRMNDTRQVNRLLGVSLDPKTNEHVLVTTFRSAGNLRQYIEGNDGKPSWDSLLALLADAAEGLHKIHSSGCVHKNLHTGNILINLDPLSSYISDIGISLPADVNSKDNLYGVLPFLAPEILHGGVYTPAADIYSFGMIMFEAAAGELPFQTREYNLFLTIDICNGVRPEIPNYVPQCFAQLIERCWETDPDRRPSAVEIAVMLTRWNLRKPPEFANKEEIRWEVSNKESSMSPDKLEQRLRVTSRPLDLKMFLSALRDKAVSVKARESIYSDGSILETEKIYLFSDVLEESLEEVHLTF